MLATVLSCAVIGLDAELVRVEVDIASGLERVTLVGLPDAAVRESSERVRAAITNSGFYFPSHRLTINLAPADLRKEGPAYDLPIAVGILSATRQVQDPLDDALILGELSLDGSVRHVKGTLPMANTAVQQGLPPPVCPGLRCAGGGAGARHRRLSHQQFGGVDSAPAGRLPHCQTGRRGIGRSGRRTGLCPRLRGRQRAGDGQTCAGGGLRRRAQCADAGVAGSRQDAAGAGAAVHPAHADTARGAGRDAHLFGGGCAAVGSPAGAHPPLSRAAPHDQPCRSGRRRHLAAAGRNQHGAQRGLISGRILRIWHQEPGGAAPAAGRPADHHLTRARVGHVSRQLHFDRGGQPLSMRLLRGYGKALHLLCIHDQQVPEAHLRPHPRPHRHPPQRAACADTEAGVAGARRIFTRDPPTASRRRASSSRRGWFL